MPLPAWRRNQLAITVAACLVFGGFTLVLPFLPYYVELVGVRGRAVNIWSGVLLSVAPFLAAIMAPFWGRLADRYGMKIMVQRTTIAMVIHWTLMAFAQNVYHLLALRIFLGLFSGFATMSVALVTQGAPKEKIGRIVGTLQAAQILAAAAGPFIGGALYEAIGLRATCFITALFCAGGFALISYAYDDRDVRHAAPLPGERPEDAGLPAASPGPRAAPSSGGAVSPQGPPGGALSRAVKSGVDRPARGGIDDAEPLAMAPPAPARRKDRDRVPLREIARLPGFAGIAVVLFCSTVISRSFGLVTPIEIRQLAAGASGLGLLAGIAVSAGSLAEAVSAMIQGRIAARFPPQVLIFIGLALASIAVLPMMLVTSVTGFTLLRALQGFLAGGTLTLGYTIGGEVIPERVRATGYGLLSSAAMMGGAFGPTLAGLISYGFGMPWVFAASAVGYAALALLALAGIRRELELERSSLPPPPRPYIPIPR